MKKFLVCVLMLFSGVAVAADAKPVQQKYQMLFLASLVNGWCQAKQQPVSSGYSDRT